mmetsp:Transcript_20214/g.53942  ORF Transcript_20214/g.53942 Transcript_20214/m.53942 type:complete len:214 (-) Transcript_20214:382-1023(-)
MEPEKRSTSQSSSTPVGRTAYWTKMALQCPEALARLQIPYPARVVVRSRDKGQTVWRKRGRVNVALVTVQCLHTLAVCVPDLGGLVSGTSDEEQPVRRKVNRLHNAPVAPQRGLAVACLSAPDLGGPVPRTSDNLGAIGRESGAEDVTGVAIQDQHASPCLDVPNLDAFVVGTGHNVLAIRRERRRIKFSRLFLQNLQAHTVLCIPDSSSSIP